MSLMLITLQEPEMRHDVIPPLSDCVQLSVEQYRSKLYDIIRSEKAARRKQEVDKQGERRASSHELRDKTKEREREVRTDVVRKVASEVNMRGQSAGGDQLPGVRGHVLAGRRLATAGVKTFEEQKQSLKETLRQSMTSGYCYRTTANFIKNKS